MSYLSISTLERKVTSNRSVWGTRNVDRRLVVHSTRNMVCNYRRNRMLGNHRRNRMLGSRRRKRMGSSKVRRRTLWELRRQAVSSKKANTAPPDAA